jgi:dTDP-4-dehydrorhamnose 3,5-epimerase
MNVAETSLPGVLLLTPRIFPDARGVFFESFNLRRIVEAGLPQTWVQDNESRSRKNVLRGIHYQVILPQAKLVRVTHGAILDVAVDLRRSSPAFGKHVAVELTADSGQMLWIPVGFGHAFLALTGDAHVVYKVTDYYSQAGERSIVFNDPDLAIPWPIAAEEAIVAEKDRAGARFRDAEVFDE